jgi:hypothetical protein
LLPTLQCLALIAKVVLGILVLPSETLPAFSIVSFSVKFFILSLSFPKLITITLMIEPVLASLFVKVFYNLLKTNKNKM